MDDSQDFDSLHLGTIKDEDSFEAGYPEDSQGGEFRMLEPGMPSHLGVGRQQGKRFMRRQEKAMANFGTCFPGQIIGLIVEVAVGLWTYDVGAAHRPFVLFSRSSRRRCFSCQ